jgi:twitching motility protein PilT
VVCQRLLPKVGGDRIAAFEVMGTNLRVREVIENGESEGKTFYEIIEGSQPFGMMTFDQCIADLFKRGLITEKTAVSYASRKSVIGRSIDAIKSIRGEKTTTIEDLKIDADYGKKERR